MLALLLLAACSGDHGDLQRKVQTYVVAAQPAAAAQQVLRRRLAMSPRTLDPSLATGVPAINVIADLFEGLTSIGPDGQMQPGVATSWKVSDDGKTYVFHLRPKARWSNGEPLTANDFVYAWRRQVDPRTGAQYAQSLAPIVNAPAIIAGKKSPNTLGVFAVDAHTLQVDLSERTPYFLIMLHNSYFMPLYQPAIEKWGDAWTRPNHTVSNGAFTLTEWVINGHLTLSKNRYYHDAANVRLREEIYYPIQARSSALSRYLAGDIDFVNSPAFPASDANWLRRTLGKQVSVSPYYGCAFLGMLVNKPPFNNRDLRLALSMSLDRKTLANKLSRGLVLPAYSLFPPLPGYVPQLPEWAHWPMQKRLTEARRLYHAAGYSRAHPLKVKLLYMTEGVQTRNYIEAVVLMWHQALGAEITPWNEQWKVMLQDIQYKNADLYWSAWIGDYPAPYTFAQQFVKGFAMNYGDYGNPAYESKVNAAVAAPDTAKRFALYEQGEAILNADAPFLPLYFYKSAELVKPYVAGYQPNVQALHLARYMWIRKHTVTGA